MSADPRINRSYRGRKDTYRILRGLAIGGMGSVYDAEDGSGRSVVVKFPLEKYKDGQYDPEQSQRVADKLQVESDFLKRFAGHPLIARHVDESPDPGEFFLVIESIDGLNLREKISSGGTSEENITKYTLDILDALDHLHKNNIIYRDLKPDNIMVGRDGRCILIDFGSVKQGRNVPEATNATQMRSPGWECPEFDTRASAECDLYSLGKVMYYMATGMKSWNKDGSKSHEDGDGRLKRPGEIRPGMSPRLSDLITDLIDPVHGTFKTVESVRARLGPRTDGSETHAGPDHARRLYQGKKGRYRIVSELAKSSMGHVFQAEDGAGRSVVLKFPADTNQLGDPYKPEKTQRMIDMVKAESDFLKRLAGPPSIAKHIDESRDPDDFFLVIEKIDGDNLFCKIQSGAISEKEVVSFSLYILEALGHIHDNGIIYRDMKPENIMVRPDGRCILIDFGGAKQGENAPDSTNTTQIRTKGWECPEYDVRASAECDLYSLGKVMYYMATGTKPWDKDDDKSNEDRTGQLKTRPGRIKPGMNSELSDLIYDLVDPVHRTYHTAREVVHKLKSIDLEHTVVEPPRQPAGTEAGRKTVVTAPPHPPAGKAGKKAAIAGVSISLVAILVIVPLQMPSLFDDPGPADAGIPGGPPVEAAVEDTELVGAPLVTQPGNGAGPGTAAPPPEPGGPAADSGVADAPPEVFRIQDPGTFDPVLQERLRKEAAIAAVREREGELRGQDAAPEDGLSPTDRFREFRAGEASDERNAPSWDDQSSGTVYRVEDGKTINVDGAQGSQIKLSLVDAAEWGEVGYEEALSHLRSLCPQKGVVTYDRDNGLGMESRTFFARIWCWDSTQGAGAVSVNEMMIESGLATLYKPHCSSSEFGREPWAGRVGC